LVKANQLPIGNNLWHLWRYNCLEYDNNQTF